MKRKKSKKTTRKKPTTDPTPPALLTETVATTSVPAPAPATVSPSSSSPTNRNSATTAATATTVPEISETAILDKHLEKTPNVAQQPQEVNTTTTTTNERHDNTDQDLLLDDNDTFLLWEASDRLLDFSKEVSLLIQIWNWLLALAAVLDFCAATVDSDLRYYLLGGGGGGGTAGRRRRQDNENETVLLYTHDYKDHNEPGTTQLLHTMAHWLRRHSFQLGMLFSILWFIDAFLTAAQSRTKALRKADEERLLSQAKDENKGQQEPKNDHKTTKTISHAKMQWKVWTVFVRSILWQLLLLPVGFYVLMYANTRRWMWGGDDDDDEGSNHFGHVESEEVTFTLHEYHHRLDTHVAKTHHFTAHSNVSVLFTLFQYLEAESLETLQLYVIHQAKRRLFRFARRALRHPVKLIRTITRITKFIRWIKIVGPLVGTSNKLLGNTVDLLKRIRQRREANKALRLRRLLWKELSEEELRWQASILIQKTYRASRARRATNALRLLQGDLQRIAAIKLQTRFRALLRQSQARLKRKKLELARLERRLAEKKGGKTTMMSEQERRRMYSLRQELTATTQKLVNQKLLLRPNTTFAVVWKSMFVAAVILELGTLIAKTLYPKQVSVDFIVPVPFSELPECQVVEDHGLFRKFFSFIGGKDTTPPHPLPRYCDEDMVALQAIGMSLWRFLIELTILAVYLIFFFDVPINFFTGRFDSVDGTLTPQPPFVRWVAPGVILQLALNPKMDQVAEFIAHMVTSIRALGPVRVFRWTVAFFFPVFVFFLRHVSRLWLGFVAEQNGQARRSRHRSIF